VAAVRTAPDLLARRLLVFTGKGGVGKSTVAAATALLAADHGQRVLLVDVDGKGSVTQLFEAPAVGFEPRQIHPGVLAMSMDTEASLREYLKLQLRMPVFGRLGPVARAFDFVAGAAPGVREILTIGKICWEVRASIEGTTDVDLVVVDAPASGHVVAQLGAADSIRELVDVGPIREQTEWLASLLADPAVTAVNVVTTPEEMPVAETIDLVDTVRAKLDVPLGVVVVNRVLPEPFTVDDERTFDALRRDEPRSALAREVGEGADDVLAAAALAVSLRRAGVEHIERLVERVDLPLLYLPYVFLREQGMRGLRVVAEALGQELGL
jgi:anion-transporting  ArsA/GET3 family ATPase